MDQNHIPTSSPIQSHHNAPRPSRTESSVSGTIPRPQTSHGAPQSGVVRRSQDASGSGLTQEDGVVQWASGSDECTWPDRNAEAGPSSQPHGVGGRVPPPQLSFPPTGVSTAPPPPTLTIPTHPCPSSGSPLLTSEPLNRTSSSQTSPALGPSPSPMPNLLYAPPPRTHKRNRALSLPAADPVYKRRRCHASDVPTPSDHIVRSYAGRRREASYHSRQQGRARVLGEKLLAGRPLRGGCRAGEQIIIASRLPPINLKTLRALDAGEIIKNPQLRHDLLFDTLAFRPVNVSADAQGQVNAGELFPAGYDPSQGLDYGPRQGCTVSDMYWDSISAEIERGCRCTRWQVSANAKLTAAGVKDKERLAECICGQWKADATEDEWWRWQKSSGWQTRIPELIQALREILISLMGSTTPCPNHFAHSFSREALDLHELACPTVTHALVPQLYEALDPDFITRCVRRGTFDLSVFRMLGEAMKVHCAPIRDVLVDDMVHTAMGFAGVMPDVATGLRKCFDCVEVMKLDIANHQVHALRPHLWTCAVQNELQHFDALVSASNVTRMTSITRSWIRAASTRALAAAQPDSRRHLIGQCACADKTEITVRAVADGFVALVFSDWPAGAQWPPMTHRRMIQMGALMGDEPVDMSLPESLRMDSRRIKGFYAEALEITIIHMIVRICQPMLIAIRPKDTSAKAIQGELRALAVELEGVVEDTPFPHFVAVGQRSELALRIAGRLVQSCGLTDRLDSIAERLDTFMSTWIRPDSPFLKTCLARVDRTMRLLLTNEMLRARQAGSGGATVTESSCKFANRVAGDAAVPAPDSVEAVWGAGARSRHTSAVKREREQSVRETQREAERAMLRQSELVHVEASLRALAVRMEKIAGFHVTAFADVYAEKGMMVGS